MQITIRDFASHDGEHTGAIAHVEGCQRMTTLETARAMFPTMDIGEHIITGDTADDAMSKFMEDAERESVEICGCIEN